MPTTTPARPTKSSCAVIVSAYRATRWIRETIESIRAQEGRDGWSYSLRIGVDGCDETSQLLLDEGEPHWFSTRNVGPYVMRNSLIQLEQASAYAVFDADDVMQPHYLTELLSYVGNGIAGAARTHIDERGAVIRSHAPYQGGVAVISHQAWQALGGYRDWFIAADHDLICRAKANRIRVTRYSRPLYLRRVHPGSLTQDPVSGLGTMARAGHKEMTDRLIKAGARKVEPVTTPLEWRRASVTAGAA